MSFERELKSGIQQLGLELQPAVQERLLAYLELLQKWNRVYNLTAIRREQWVSHHLLDSLAVLPHLWGKHWLDVGCGAGLPGIVLAIARPEWQFTLVDSNSKKTSFVQQAIIDLKLENAAVCCTRVESWQVSDKFDGIISRAFANIADFVTATRHLLAPEGRWAAMKGDPAQELTGVPEAVVVEKTIPLKIPGLEAARCLVVLKAN